MANIWNIFSILFLLTSQMVLAYHNYQCSDFGSWQPGCSGPGSMACAVPTESGAYCISRCYNNACSWSKDAARGFKEYICNTYGYAADYVQAENGEIDLAIHRNKNSQCGSYDNTFDFVPYAQRYSETQEAPNQRIPK